MIIEANLFSAIVDMVHLVLVLYMYVVIARAVISWINVNPHNQIVQFIYRITEPPLATIRRYIPAFGGLDLSPVILILAIIIIDRIILSMRYSAL